MSAPVIIRLTGAGAERLARLLVFISDVCARLLQLSILMTLFIRMMFAADLCLSGHWRCADGGGGGEKGLGIFLQKPTIQGKRHAVDALRQAIRLSPRQYCQQKYGELYWHAANGQSVSPAPPAAAGRNGYCGMAFTAGREPAADRRRYLHSWDGTLKVRLSPAS